MKDKIRVLTDVPVLKKRYPDCMLYLEECDIFALPSYFERQSLSVLGVMANVKAE